MSNPFHYSWVWQLASSPKEIWPYISDTDRFNYDVGLGRVIFNRPAASGHGRHLKMRLHNLITLEWEEEPFQWVRDREFSVQRRYLSGPIKTLRVQVQLTPLPQQGTQLTYQVWATPRHLLSRLLIPVQIGWLNARAFEKTVRRYDELAQAAQPLPELATRAQLSPEGVARLDTIRARLAEALQPPALVEQLIDFVTRADEYVVADIRPFQLADAWQASRRTMLTLCLQAVRAGLLDFEWQVLCPHCRNAGSNMFNHLNELSADVHCDSCQIDFKANFHRSVEVVFKPNAAIRPVMRAAFCVGGPQVTPHVLAQQQLAAQQSVSLSLPLANGRYRLRSNAHAGEQSFWAWEDGIENQATISAHTDGWQATTDTVTTSPTLTLQNQTSQPQLFILEQMAWQDQAVTAAEVTMLQTFRDLFAHEALRPGEQFSVGSIAILFTDLVDSTRLYNEIGDAPAFGLVLNHFDVLREQIDAEEGAIIKTIGDAVMAVFRHPAAAIRALAQAQAILANPPAGQKPLYLKGALNMGTSINVSLNGRLDYFGSTINIAARLEKFSGANKIVVTDAVYQDPDVQQLLQTHPPFVAEPFETALKGFDNGRFCLWRIHTKQEQQETS